MTPVSAGHAAPSPAAATLGRPRVHLRRTDSTNERARALAIAGAPHGALVSAAEQSAGRGRQGRSWAAPPDSALLCSLVLRDPPELLSLRAGVAVCDAVGEYPMTGHTQRAHGKRAQLKWPNDVVVGAAAAAQPTGMTAAAPAGDPSQCGLPNATALAKLAGILVEGRPQEGWAVLGIGLNVAVRIEQLPADVRAGAASLELPSSAIEPLLDRLVEALERRLAEPLESVLDAWRSRDALLGREVCWGTHPSGRPSGRGEPRGGRGRAAGIDGTGRLLVTLPDGATTKLDAGEIHLGPAL